MFLGVVGFLMVIIIVAALIRGKSTRYLCSLWYL